LRTLSLRKSSRPRPSITCVRSACSAGVLPASVRHPNVAWVLHLGRTGQNHCSRGESLFTCARPASRGLFSRRFSTVRKRMPFCRPNELRPKILCRPGSLRGCNLAVLLDCQQTISHRFDETIASIVEVTANSPAKDCKHRPFHGINHSCRRNETAGRAAKEREKEMLRHSVAGALCLALVRPYVFSRVSFTSAYSKVMAKQ